MKHFTARFWFDLQYIGCSELENPIGIETKFPDDAKVLEGRCSELENPIGIETDFVLCKITRHKIVAANLKTR